MEYHHGANSESLMATDGAAVPRWLAGGQCWLDAADDRRRMDETRRGCIRQRE
jgi:hypothetical protein